MTIPKLSKERINELYSRIKPVYEYKRRLYYMKDVDLFNIAFTWDPKPLKPASGLEKIVDIETLHTWAFYGFFKPTIEEVLCQIPKEYINRTIAFRTELVSDDPSIAIRGDYHVATTTLYEKSKRSKK